MPQPIHLRPVRWAAYTAVPHPAKGSKTTSPGLLDASINTPHQRNRFLGRITQPFLCVGCNGTNIVPYGVNRRTPAFRPSIACNVAFPRSSGSKCVPYRLAGQVSLVLREIWRALVEQHWEWPNDYQSWRGLRHATGNLNRHCVNGGGMLGHWGVDVQRLCQGNGPAIMSVVAVSSQ